MGNMRYKAGDKVRIKSLDWYNENKDEYGYVRCTNFLFTPEHSKYCGCEFTISHITEFQIPSYVMEGNGHEWTDEMIEGLVEEESQSKEMSKENAKHYWKVINGGSKPKFKVGDKVTLDLYPCVVTTVEWKGDSEYVGYVYTVRGTDFGKKVKEVDLVFDERTVPNTNEIIHLIKNDWDNFKDRYDIPDDYHFVDKNGNEINISEIVLEKKKKEYPKTYEECCKVMNYCCNPVATKTTHKEELIRRFQFLLLYRDAYWKIAGKEMGLGKPWEPSKDKMVYSFYRHSNYIETDVFSGESATFEFPTAKMRDAFYENFKGLIEECKELL